MKYFKLVIFGLVILTIFNSCYYDKEELLYPQVASTCDTANVTYKTNVSAILGDYCYSCHNNSVASSYGGNIKLQDYVDVYSNITKVYGAISHQNGYSAMPKGGSKLSDCKIHIIKIWMDAGSLNN